MATLERYTAKFGGKQFENWTRDEWGTVVGEVRIEPDTMLTIGEAAWFVGNRHGLHDGAIKTLLKQMMDAVGHGLIVRHPHTGLPYVPSDRVRGFYELIRADELDSWLQSQKVSYRIHSQPTQASPADYLKPADFVIWTAVQLWTLVEAACLLSGKEPIAGEIFTKLGFHRDRTLASAAAIYADLKDAIQLGQLECLPSRIAYDYGRRVKPVECVAWVMSTLTSHELPPELVVLAKDDGKVDTPQTTTADTHVSQATTGEPPMRCGSNVRANCNAWAAWQAEKLKEPGDTIKSLAKRITDLANDRKYRMEGGDKMSIHLVTSAIPAGLTGTRKKNGNNRRKK